jgi:predicted Zn-dependent protease
MTNSDDTMGTSELEMAALTSVVGNTSGVSQWQATITRAHEAQLYLIGERVESRRTVTSERARVMLMHDHAAPESAGQPAGPARGWSTVTVLASELAAPERLAARLRDGVYMASVANNPPYDLPAAPPAPYLPVQTVDPALADPAALANALEEARAALERAVAVEPGVRLASAEFYATLTQSELQNSHGLTAQSAGTQVFLDFILIARDGEREAEVHGELRRRRMGDLVIPQMVAAHARFARDTLRAETPATYQGPVILSGMALTGMANLFAPVAFHASAEARFKGLARIKVGEPITGVPLRGDALTVTSDPTRPFFAKTAPYDAEGTAAASVTVIEQGVLRTVWANQRYGQYLDVPVTGEFGNLVIELGQRSLAELRTPPPERPIYEVVEFSALFPDFITGDISSEIRLGYRYDPDGRVTPIKGGTLAGNLFTALSDVQLSREAFSNSDYYGPAAFRFGALTIAGT